MTNVHKFRRKSDFWSGFRTWLHTDFPISPAEFFACIFMVAVFVLCVFAH